MNLRNAHRPKSEPRGARGLNAWLPEPDAPAFFGLDRDVPPVAFTAPRPPLSWLAQLRLRVMLWWWS